MMHTVLPQLTNRGFVVVEDLLTPAECDEMVQTAKDLAENLGATEDRKIFSTKEEHLKDDEYFMQSNDKICAFFEDKALDKDGALLVEPKMSLNKLGHALHLLNPIFRCYTYCHRVKSLCKAIGLKRPVVVQSMFIFKNPGNGGEVVPHQDATFLHADPIPPIGFWIALEDATLENGCLWIASGSHLSGVHRRLMRNPDPNSTQKLVYDKPAPVYPNSSFIPVPVKKGTCIILHGLVVHKSAMNRSDKSRPAYTFHIVEKKNNTYSPDNWLQEGKNAPFNDMYSTRQLM